MAQLTLYIDEKTMRLLKQAAKHTNESMSSWAKKRLLTSLKNTWPKDFFALAGSLSNVNGFDVPADVSWDKAAKRELL